MDESGGLSEGKDRGNNWWFRLKDVLVITKKWPTDEMKSLTNELYNTETLFDI